MMLEMTKGIFLTSALGLLALARGVQSEPAAIAEIALDRDSFNPSARESVTLTYSQVPAGAAEVLIYDPDGGLMRRLPINAKTAGRVVWDGRDDAGSVVPDEAYTFTIKSADGAVYDPATFSGDTVGDITDAVVDARGNLSYRLPAPARVLIRLGVHNGPMYRTLVDWRPRPTGTVNESWDGFDAKGLMRIRDHPDFSVLATYVTLSETTVITYGNAAETYRDYKLDRGQGRPKRPPLSREASVASVARRDFPVPPAWTRTPVVVLDFPDFPDPTAVPEVKRSVAVRIDVAPEDRARLAEDQFEVIFYVDGVFFAEAERGYLPLNWSWELNALPPGERVLTVNIASFRGQVGVASRKVVLVR